MQSAINAWQWEETDDHATRRLIRGLQKMLGESKLLAAASPGAANDFVSGLFHDAVLHEIVANYHDNLHLLDEEGEIGVFAEACADELQRCLKSLAGVAKYVSSCNAWSETLKELQEIP